MKNYLKQGFHKTSILLLCFVYSFTLTAQNPAWIAPKDASATINPLKVLPKNASAGKTIFMRSCKSCHGVKADGNGLMQSTSLISPAFQKQTDGDVFYKINTGHDKMPPFKGVLKEEEIWSLVNYFRVLANPNVLPPAKEVRMQLACITKGRIKIIKVFLYEIKDTSIIPASEVDVHFYFTRDFGLKRFGEEFNYTDASGKVAAVCPDDIIGDKNGSIKIIVKLEDNMMYKPVLDSARQTWGKPLVGKSELASERSLFGSRDKAPLWLLFLANGILAGVWFFIGYVVWYLFKIKKLSDVFIK